MLLTSIERAFVEAARILERLEKLGCYLPSFELFADGSCRLKIRLTMSDGSAITKGTQQVASGLLYSDRWQKEGDYWVLDSCYGLFTAVGKREE